MKVTKSLGLFSTLVGAAILMSPLSALAWDGGHHWDHDRNFRADCARVDRDHDGYRRERRNGFERRDHEREEWLEHHRDFDRGSYRYWNGFRSQPGYARWDR